LGDIAVASDGTTSPYSTSKEIIAQYEGNANPTSNSSLYYVVIDSAAGGTTGGATFKYSKDGASFEAGSVGEGESGQDVLAPTSSTGNTELGSGLRLTFAGTNMYAIGQAWQISVGPPTFSVQTTPSVRENKICSGRGACNTASGACTCYPGYTGADCSIVSTAT